MNRNLLICTFSPDHASPLAMNRQDPVKWLDDFFAACDLIQGGCGVTAIAVHSYTCEVGYGMVAALSIA